MFLLPPALGILFIIIGNYMWKVKSKWFVGVRTPWTLSNEEVWNKTNRLGGKIFVGLGLFFIIGVFLPTKIFWGIFIVGVPIVALVPIIYSYVLYRKLTK